MFRIIPSSFLSNYGLQKLKIICAHVFACTSHFCDKDKHSHLYHQHFSSVIWREARVGISSNELEARVN
jgi:hypothetical protein